MFLFKRKLLLILTRIFVSFKNFLENESLWRQSSSITIGLK